MYKGGTGMKRDRSDRGDSPQSGMSKRSRSGTLGRYDDDSDEGSVDNARRHGSGSRQRGSPPRRYEDYNNSRSYKESSRGHSGSHSSSGGAGNAGSGPYPYKVLCISSLHTKASDEVVRETLYREFKRFGDISVKIVHEPDERVAYVYFRCYEDARDAKHSKSRIIIYDKPVMVEAAYESVPATTATAPPPSASYRGHASSPPTGSHHHGGGAGEYDKYYRRSSPVYDNRGHHDGPPRGREERGFEGHGGRMEHHGPRGYGSFAPPPPPPMGREYGRRDAPPLHHHGGEYMGRPPPQPYARYGPRGEHGHGAGNHHMHAPPPGGSGNAGRYENKKDKFPNYLHHVMPEDDPLATRTLFAGNLEVNITDEELRRIFTRYGSVEDIDIKRPPPGTGNAYAFVRYVNLDMAARAKTELSGQYIGKFQCKIGYGKVNPTTKIWIGGLGAWTTMQQLEREFDRFGCIKKIDWAKGEPYAYITYETIDAAQAAVKDMRGYPLGGPDRRLRTDFADANSPPAGYGNLKRDYDYNDGMQRGAGGNGNSGGGGGGGGSGFRNREEEGVVATAGSTHSGGTDLCTSPGSDTESLDRSRSRRNNGSVTGTPSSTALSGVRSVSELTRKAPLGWQGSLILKNSSFPCRMHILEGEVEVVESIMKDDDNKPQLRITQRLRLDQSKLDDVQKRVATSSAHGVLMAVPINPGSPEPGASSSPGVQSRPLRNLVSYLKQKEAAGVISLNIKEAAPSTGVLYAFPPCAFSSELLQKSVPALEAGAENSKEEYLMIVVIRGGQV